MTKKLSECAYCKRPADEHGGINHVGGCTGLQDIPMNRLQYDILRADISQAYDLRDKAEGRYCTALMEIERLQKEYEEMEARCAAALWLVPGDKLCGDLQKLRNEFKVRLAHEPCEQLEPKYECHVCGRKYRTVEVRDHHQEECKDTAESWRTFSQGASRDLSASEAASFHKTLARSPRIISLGASRDASSPTEERLLPHRESSPVVISPEQSTRDRLKGAWRETTQARFCDYKGPLVERDGKMVCPECGNS